MSVITVRLDFTIIIPRMIELINEIIRSTRFHLDFRLITFNNKNGLFNKGSYKVYYNFKKIIDVVLIKILCRNRKEIR